MQNIEFVFYSLKYFKNIYPFILALEIAVNTKPKPMLLVYTGTIIT